jgi:NADPH-dependent glutamate synthase beta subunit-like oxidoreductase
MLIWLVGVKGKGSWSWKEKLAEVWHQGKLTEDAMRERDLDELVAGACVLRSDTAIKQIDKAFITAADDRNEWVT